MKLSHLLVIDCGLPMALLIGACAPMLLAQDLAPIIPEAVVPVAPGQPVLAPLSAPRVVCKDNELTIVAENASMRSILMAVQGCIGVPIEVPAGTANQRSYVHLGPGPANDILEALLAPTDIDFVLQASSTRPEKIQRVLLFGRSTDAADAKSASLAASHEISPARRAWLASKNTAATDRGGQESPDPQPAEEAGAPQVSEEAAPTPVAAESKPPVAPDPAVASQESAPANNNPAPSASDADSATGGKVLQDKITDMQQLFEQRKKMAASPVSTPNQN